MTKIRIQSFTLALFFFCSAFVFSQPGNPAITTAHKHFIDFLLTVLKDTKEDSNKVDILYSTGFRYIRLADYNEAIRYLNQPFLLAQKLDFLKKRKQMNIRI